MNRSSYLIFLQMKIDRQSLIQASPRIVQPKLLRISVELQRLSLSKFHQDLAAADVDADQSWFDRNPSVSRTLSVLTSCPEIFSWIHSKLSELLLELHLSQFCEKDAVVDLPKEVPFQETSWSLRKVIFMLSDSDLFKGITYQILSGIFSVCFESNSSHVCRDISKCFISLLPNELEMSVTNTSGFWHSCFHSDCRKLLKVKLISENRFEVDGPVDSASLSSQLVRQVFEIVSRSEVAWQVSLVQLQALKDRWISQAKIWTATRKCADSLQKEFLKMRNLKQSDIQILDYWSSLLK